MDVVFIGQFVSHEASVANGKISQAGNNYQLKFVELLNPKFAISIMPIFLREMVSAPMPRKDIVVINSETRLPTRLHYLYRLLSDSFKVLSLLIKLKTAHVFFYNIDKHNLLMIFFTKYVLKKKTYVVVADHSSFQNGTWTDKLANLILRKINGAIVFNSNIKVNHNQRVFPGLLYEAQIVEPRAAQEIKKNVMLSGSLGKTTGLELALSTFAARSDFNLYITGTPYKYTDAEFNKLIAYYTDNFQNIKYLGLLAYDEYVEVLNKCDIALSLRDPKDEEHQYNFPSKILEYLSKSKLVISSIEYKDLPKNYLFISGFDKDQLIQTLDYICSMDSESISMLKSEIYSYLKLNFTDKALIRICNELIEK